MHVCAYATIITMQENNKMMQNDVIDVNLGLAPFKVGKFVDHVAESDIVDIVLATDLDLKLGPQTHPLLLGGDQTGQFQFTEHTPEL